MEQLEQRVSAIADQGRTLLAALEEKVASLNLEPGLVAIPPFEEAKFTLEQDLYDDSLQTLMGSFYPRPRYRAGVLLFHADGSCYAEYHVMQPHPGKPRWFVESVEAWVRDGKVQTDLRLVAMPQ
jgi:hypothetical protein